MPWNGYNFEDAIMISREGREGRHLHFDSHRRIRNRRARHQARAGRNHARHPERRAKKRCSNLGPDGVIRVGAEVKPGDILVGKITPKSETELAPEERLLRAIFGEKAADVKDTSLTVPSGTYGIVMDVKVSSRREDCARKADARRKPRRQLKAIDGRQPEEEGRAARATDRCALATSCSAKRFRSTS